MSTQSTVRVRPRVTWAVVAVLTTIVLVFFVLRLVADVPPLVRGTVPPPTAFEQRYVRHPVPAYVHIVPGVLFLLGGAWQLSGRFRNRHLVLHRRLGRFLVGGALLSGVLAVVIGVWFPYGGTAESGASVVFGLLFVVEIVLGARAIRARRVLEHRRWMIRAYAVGLGVGTIRLWIGLFTAVGLLSITDNRGTAWFGVAFWIAFVLHVLVAEAYLRVAPRPGVRKGRGPGP
ncbi:DUF2306 domain-containing protein [Actinomycetospora termitidis]|uniref:DUF2306 domain-containing protein n=1 Tax=Actinomycetospora termitidis TaxID=3053470 RepID=A0ABT7MFP8_9PSEU|nr:DUF2306 domain-containing protein [Actinomycetospora sp. Odt1-22]MDL5159485.1 DUF2306 domain-containing protein [Actinomycetospora sp. Odt1-22]